MHVSALCIDFIYNAILTPIIKVSRAFKLHFRSYKQICTLQHEMLGKSVSCTRTMSICIRTSCFRKGNGSVTNVNTNMHDMKV